MTALAKQIQAAQNPEILLIRTWLRDGNAEELPHSGGPGEESDGHEHEMAEQVIGTTDDLEVQALAQEIISAQAREIDLMRELQAD